MEMLIKGQQRHIRLKNVIVFTEAIFGEGELACGSVGGNGVRGREPMDTFLVTECAAGFV